MKILLVGMNHESAPVEVRERYAVGDPEPLLGKLVACEDVDEAVILSTCNRVELCVTTHHVESATHTLLRFFERELAHGGGAPAPALDHAVYVHSGRAAAAHVLRVAASIDSMVVGEPQILGQVKDAYRAAVEAGACGPVLSRLFQRAFATAKRVKNETGIAQRPVSVARVAVDLARQIFERFDDKRALLVGAGDMTELALEALVREGLRHVHVANRTRSHAEELAARFGATAHGLDELDALLADADVVLTSIGADEPIVTAERARAALAARRRRPLFFIDIGVPRNVHPDVDGLENAYLYDVDDLQQVSERNAEERQREALRAEGIVREEEQRFDGWLVALEAVPTIRHLRERAEAIRTSELERALARSPRALGAEEREVVERATRAIVNKLLHPPLAKLRAETDREEGIAMLEAARALFGLDEPIGRAGVRPLAGDGDASDAPVGDGARDPDEGDGGAAAG
ncbi:MAG: glutamyl-tRNA reductase [Myxococcota bacterium]|nr:glutamyl-tRNA reductase [Myxococcales bacterium]